MYTVKIKDKRKNLGLTQQEMADHLGTTRKYVGEIENGKVIPGFEILDRMACVLDCSVYDLYSGTYSGSRYYSDEINAMREKLMRQVGKFKECTEDLVAEICASHEMG